MTSTPRTPADYVDRPPLGLTSYDVSDVLRLAAEGQSRHYIATVLALPIHAVHAICNAIPAPRRRG